MLAASPTTPLIPRYIVSRLAKRIAILGSTGSIGANALAVIEHLGTPYRAVALSAHRQTQKLIEQVKRHRPAAVAVTDPDTPRGVIEQIRSLGCEVYSGPEGLVELVRREDVDLVVAAVVGAAGLPAVLAAVRAGKALALANKEALVVAGSLLIPEVKKRKLPLLPIDSEHSAIFQACLAGRLDEVRRVILTASGGPFRTATLEQMERATLADALRHPTWRMGNKVTIDSATMFNKALEIIEACWLFDLPPEKVEVVIHPESIVHSMVEFVDGSVLAQMSPPDMRTPIQYALTYPERRQGLGNRMNLASPFSLNFSPPDLARFPALRIAYDVARTGGTLGAVMNAANEAAVEAFVAGKIRFIEIPRLVERTIAVHQVQQSPSLDDLLEADGWARRSVFGLIDSGPLAATLKHT
jgi:1-deoxy-D-xylulose-5-phosphate reductoisomerase